MDKRIQGALIGMILGDAHVNVRHRLQSGKYPYLSAEMRILHGPQQAAYCEFKCALVNQLLGRNATVNRVRNGPGGRYEAVHFTVSHPYFKLLKTWCYPEGKKRFERFVLDHLTPEGIALWYMDDGSARRNYNSKGRVSSVATEIATCCSQTEAETVCAYFEEVHKIVFRPRCLGPKYASEHRWLVQCNTADSRQFCHLVRPWVIEPMLYKLSHVADLTSHECRAPVGACCACNAPIFANRRTGLCDACYSRRYYHQVRKRAGDEIVRPAGKPAEVVDKEPPW